MEIPPEALAYKPENREKIRRAIAKVVEAAVREAGTKLISVERVKAAGATDQNATTRLLKLWRDGALTIVESWGEPAARDVAALAAGGGPIARLQLAARIRAATTDAEREASLHELAALVVSGDVDPDEAGQIKGAMTEARLAAEARRANDPPAEDPTKLLLASPEALEAARSLDLIEDDDRRDRVLAFIGAELDADMLQNPNTDQGGAR